MASFHTISPAGCAPPRRSVHNRQPLTASPVRDRFTRTDAMGGVRWYGQFEDVRPWYGASSVASRPQTARPATLSKAEAIAKVANGEYQRNKLRNSCNNIFG
jgi:hypothetical protein